MLLKRILTVFVAAPFVIGMILCPESAVFKVFVVACLLVALWEFFSIVGFGKAEKVFGLGLGLFHSLYLLFCPKVKREDLLEASLLLIVVFVFFIFRRREKLEGVAHQVGLTLLGGLYISTLGATVGLARDLPDGVFWVFLILAMTWLNDTFAYFVGHRFGRRKLAPLISPGKTVEGFVGGFFGSLVGFLLFWLLLDNPLKLTDGLILTALVGCLGPLGDLSESLIKRGFQVKDSGNVIPGHGGMLDRIDALLFTAPVVYWYAFWWI